jgi:hypothetical protein
MHEQAKMERVLRLIRLLKERRCTVSQLATSINTSTHTLYLREPNPSKQGLKHSQNTYVFGLMLFTNE